MWRGWESWFGLWGRPWACPPPMLWMGPGCSWPRGIPWFICGKWGKGYPGGPPPGWIAPGAWMWCWSYGARWTGTIWEAAWGGGVGNLRIMGSCACSWTGGNTGGGGGRCPITPRKTVAGSVGPGPARGGILAWKPWVDVGRRSRSATTVTRSLGGFFLLSGPLEALTPIDSCGYWKGLAGLLYWGGCTSSPPSLSPPFSVSDISSSPLFLAFSFPLLWRYYQKDFLRAFPSRPFAFPLLLLAGTGRFSFTLLSPRLLWPSWRSRGGSPSLVKVGESWLLHCWTVHGSAGALVVIRTRQQQLIHRGGGQWGARPWSDWVFCQKIQPVKRETSQRILFCQAGSYFGGCEVQINRSQKVWN